MGCLGHRNGRYRHSRWLNVSFTGTTVYLFNSFIITGLNIPIEAFRIKVSDRSYASTSGNLQIGVKQGDQNSCQTVVETFTSPQTNVLYLRDDKSLFGSCWNNSLPFISFIFVDFLLVSPYPISPYPIDFHAYFIKVRIVTGIRKYPNLERHVVGVLKPRIYAGAK